MVAWPTILTICSPKFKDSLGREKKKHNFNLWFCFLRYHLITPLEDEETASSFSCPSDKRDLLLSWQEDSSPLENVGNSKKHKMDLAQQASSLEYTSKCWGAAYEGWV